MKRCSKCGETRPVSEFNKNARLKSGLYSWCKTCARANSRHWYHANRERNLANMKVYREANRVYIRERSRSTNRNRSLRNRYGLTLGRFEEMLAEQSGLCAICKEPMRRPCVDHDHATRKVRGLLCDPCNQGLGLFRDDSVLLKSAIGYLAGSRKRTEEPSA